MTPIQAYLVMERLLVHLKKKCLSEETKLRIDTLLKRADVVLNSLRYGIFESEDPAVTLAWKRRIDNRGFNPRGWAIEFATGFLQDLLSKKWEDTGKAAIENCELNRIWASESESLLTSISEDDYANIATSFIANQLIEESLYLIDLRSSITKEDLSTSISVLKAIDRVSLTEFLLREREHFSTEYDCFLGYLKKIGHPVLPLSRVGKVAFGILSDLWFLFDRNVSDDNPILISLKPKAEPGEFPSREYTITRLFSGEGLEFKVAGKTYFAFYPLQDSRAYLFGNDILLESGTIVGFLTKPRFKTEARSKRFPLLKAFRASPTKRVIPPTATEERFEALLKR